MDASEREWVEYVDGEVRAACAELGVAHQVRRKGTARDKVVWKTRASELEWKLVPGKRGVLVEVGARDFDGEYYVLSFDASGPRFVFQHDTQHGGILGPHWERNTYTEIRPLFQQQAGQSGKPPPGWLRDHLIALARRHAPNRFSVT